MALIKTTPEAPLHLLQRLAGHLHCSGPAGVECGLSAGPLSASGAPRREGQPRAPKDRLGDPNYKPLSFLCQGQSGCLDPEVVCPGCETGWTGDCPPLGDAHTCSLLFLHSDLTGRAANCKPETAYLPPEPPTLPKPPYVAAFILSCPLWPVAITRPFVLVPTQLTPLGTLSSLLPTSLKPGGPVLSSI